MPKQKNTLQLREVAIKQASEAYRKSDRDRWKFALWSWMIVGKYERGASIELANYMGVSVDTVEDHAHAYAMFVEICGLGQTQRLFAFAARRLPYVHYSHFRALYDAKQSFGLTARQVFDLLFNIVFSEGSVSVGSLSNLIRDHYGKERAWTWYADKAAKALLSLRQCPDLPTEFTERIDSLFEDLSK